MNTALTVLSGDDHVYVVFQDGTTRKVSKSSVSNGEIDLAAEDSTTPTDSSHISATGAAWIDGKLVLIGSKSEVEKATKFDDEPQDFPSEDGETAADELNPIPTERSVPAISVEVGSVDISGTGTLAFIDGATRLFIRPAEAEGDHMSVAELTTGGQTRYFTGNEELTGTGVVLQENGEPRLVLADTATGCLGWLLHRDQPEQPLSHLNGGTSKSAVISADGDCVVWASIDSNMQPMVWKDEAWFSVAETAPVKDVLGHDGLWLTSDSADDWTVLNPNELDLSASALTLLDQQPADMNAAIELAKDDFCRGKLVDIINVKTLDDYPMRIRSQGPIPGIRTKFYKNPSATDINKPFHDLCEAWAKNMRWHFYFNSPYDKGKMKVSWFGSVGVVACHRSTAAHNRGRGFDLASIEFEDSNFYMDCNTAWRSDQWIGYQRRYLGVWASLRRKFITVLTNAHNTAHRDHIHFDNLSALPPLRRGRGGNRTTDTKLIQTACNLLDNASLTVDGAWGPKTEAAYNKLLSGINAAALKKERVVGDPFSSRSAAAYLLLGIQNHGISNSILGNWPGYKT